MGAYYHKDHSNPFDDGVVKTYRGWVPEEIITKTIDIEKCFDSIISPRPAPPPPHDKPDCIVENSVTHERIIDLMNYLQSIYNNVDYHNDEDSYKKIQTIVEVYKIHALNHITPKPKLPAEVEAAQMAEEEEEEEEPNWIVLLTSKLGYIKMIEAFEKQFLKGIYDPTMKGVIESWDELNSTSCLEEDNKGGEIFRTYTLDDTGYIINKTKHISIADYINFKIRQLIDIQNDLVDLLEKNEKKNPSTNRGISHKKYYKVVLDNYIKEVIYGLRKNLDGDGGAINTLYLIYTCLEGIIKSLNQRNGRLRDILESRNSIYTWINMEVPR